MALRVLKTYPDRKAFAAKYLKSYGKIESLESGQSLTAVEKVMDIPLNPIASAEITELREIEEEKSQLVQPSTSTAPPPSEALPNLEEALPNLKEAPSNLKEAPPNLKKAPLNSGDDPPPPPGTDPSESKGVAARAEKSAANQDNQSPPPGDEDDDDDQVDVDGVTIPERPKYDRYSYWLSGGLGVVRSPNPAALTQSIYMSSGNLRFGVTLSNPVFFRNSSIQDSFVLESGFFGYKVVAQTNDTYSLVGALLTLRYNLNLGERFGVFFYGGLGRGFVITASNPVLATYNALNAFIPSIGAGLLFQIGPAWYTRVDVGYEALTINLLLRL